jgi:hypothetical protein
MDDEYYGYVGPFGLGDGVFNSHVIHLSVVVSLLSLVIEICVGAFGDFKDCATSGKGIGLLQRLTDLQRRWWWWIGFWFVLLACVV